MTSAVTIPVTIPMTISMTITATRSRSPVTFPTPGLPGVAMTGVCPSAWSVNLLRAWFYPMPSNPYILAVTPFPILINPNVFRLRRGSTNNNLPLRANGYKDLC